MLSDLKNHWPPARDDPRQGYKRRLELHMERDTPLVEPLQAIPDPMWWTSCCITCATDPAAHFSVSLLAGRNGHPMETWVQPAGPVQPLTWPIPGDMATYLDFHLVVRYMGNCERAAVVLTLGFHEMDLFPNPEMELEDYRYIFVSQTGRVAMVWNAARGVGGIWGSDYLEEGELYIVVPPMHRLLGDRQWWDMRHVVHSWNDVLPR